MKNNNKTVYVKMVHSLIWLMMASAVFYVLYSGISGDLNKITYASIGLIFGETVVLVLNKGAFY